MNQRQLGSASVFLALIIIFHADSLTFADSFHAGSDGVNKRFTGTFLVREGLDQTGILLRLITVSADGNWSSVDAQQEVFGFSDQQGVWKPSGRREITANVIDFDISPGGAPAGVARIRFVMTYSQDYQTVAGTFVGESFDLRNYLDVFNPKAVPQSTFESPFEGRRVTVEVGKEPKHFR